VVRSSVLPRGPQWSPRVRFARGSSSQRLCLGSIQQIFLPRRGTHALACTPQSEASPVPAPLERSHRITGASWCGAGLDGDVWWAALESDGGSRRCGATRRQTLGRRWRGQPGRVYYPAFASGARGGPRTESRSTGSSSPARCAAGSPAGTTQGCHAAAGEHCCGSAGRSRAGWRFGNGGRCGPGDCTGRGAR
jgi:hypothetical protein